MENLSFGQAIIVFFISPILLLLQILVLVNVVLSWLISFNVVNPHNQLVSIIWRVTTSFTEPFLSPLRRFIPPLGGLDLSPLILLLLIIFVREWVLARLYVML
jgi:YggT family protein